MRDRLLSDEIERLARRVVEENAAAKRTAAVAESCTGGLVCAALTEIPGAGHVLRAGFVTYSNAAKRAQLDVPAELLETFGAVSSAVVWAMAQGALKHSDADVAVAISGVAGPTGGTDQKPVGTVVFGHATRDCDPREVRAERRSFGADLTRAEVRAQATLTALKLLLPG